MPHTGDHPPPDDPGRRKLLRFALSATLAGVSNLLLPREAEAIAIPTDLIGGRSLSFLNTHTSERLMVNYGGEGTYFPAALTQVNSLLRDHHDGSLHPIDPRLLDVLYSILHLVGGHGTLHVVSGYRSPRTNNALRLTHEGVALHSYHMQGKAIDFWLPSCPLSELHKAALSVRGGGVGYYPANNFIHVDVGPVRQWGGMGGGGGFRGHYLQNIRGGVPHGFTPSQYHTFMMRRRALAFDLARRRRGTVISLAKKSRGG
ncbi:hypothetical protein WCLP8_1270004 [uncultured Gammaproteobacteria bacterium]